MTHIPDSTKYQLDDGSRVAVIGGGPTGSFFSYFTRKMSMMSGIDVDITVYEPKNFTKEGPGGCNRCGGIISELLVQNLAVEGIVMPENLVQRGIHSYKLHTLYGDVQIETPSLERTIATVYRGGGPRGILGKGKESFDNFLLQHAVSEGVKHVPLRVDRVDCSGTKPVLYAKDESLQEADLVVGAFGVNSTTPKVFEQACAGYREPALVTAAIAEISMDQEALAHIFGHSIHLFLLPDRGIKFAAMIPKETFVTLCILGRDVTTNTVREFLAKPVVKAVLPDDVKHEISCNCLPKMNVGAPKHAFDNRMVFCGDAGSTRLFKDGLGAAYLMGKAAAKTAVFEGIGREHFQKDYLPVYRSIVVDNLFGHMLYMVIGLYRTQSLLTKAMLEVVRKEQKSPESREKILSSILWDMFTGNERYKNVFFRSLKCQMHIDMWEGVFKSLVRRPA